MEPVPMDDLDAVEVTRAFLAYCQPRVRGTLTIVTDDCWRTDVDPLEVSAADPSFAASYPEVYDSAFISGDTIVLSPATGTVIVVHHDELIATLGSVSV